MLSLKETLGYTNDQVLNKFRTLYEFSRPDAEEIARETNRWLWLNARLKADRKEGRQNIPRVLVVHEGMVVLDEYWHTFILHTRDYREFCDSHLGFFIHHSPSFPGFQPPSQEEAEEQLNYICDRVGDETLIKWYEEYPVRYSADVLTKLQRPKQFGRPCEAIT
ncbi:MAG: hypothetical protein ABI643_01710 [Candidatus Doudnabacteria bacterium]